MESKGSAIPAMVAGMARLLMDLKLTDVFKKKGVSRIQVHNNGTDAHFAWESKCPLVFDSRVAYRIFDFVDFD